MFQDSLSIPSSRVKQSKKNTGNRWVHGYIGYGVGCDRFSEKVKQANWTRRGGARIVARVTPANSEELELDSGAGGRRKKELPMPEGGARRGRRAAKWALGESGTLA
jgi:hypothetical protein